jgi:hypothetical protein
MSVDRRAELLRDLFELLRLVEARAEHGGYLALVYDGALVLRRSARGQCRVWMVSPAPAGWSLRWCARGHAWDRLGGPASEIVTGSLDRAAQLLNAALRGEAMGRRT